MEFEYAESFFVCLDFRSAAQSSGWFYITRFGK
ncbi:Uncharacterised protein [Salmonella enterica subsp. enterica]|uniref:Uncharacterized protein n=1 Tax=Salmonella enterica I TaxID=59201 RepID=A0A379W0T8_SALET|nr:Uncharacterised protein [Salmonella enterica subsp. enterica]